MTPKVAFLSLLRLISRGLNGQKEVIYIDGLDEAFGSRGRFTHLSLSEFLPRDDGPILPNGIFIVLTSRPGNHLNWLIDLKLCQVETLDPNAQDNNDDIRAYARQQNRVRNLGLTESFIEHFVDVCEGIFAVALIYLRMGSDLTKELTRQQDPSVIPRRLSDWLVKQWTQMVTAAQQQGIDQNVVRGIFGLLTIAREPLAKEHLMEFLSLKKGSPSVGFLYLEKIALNLDKVLNFSQAFFDSGSLKQDDIKNYRFFHSSFAEFISADLSEEERSDCHRFLAEKCAAWKECQGAVRDYALRHRLNHLIAAEEWDQLVKAFTETDFIVERCKKFGFAEVYSDTLFCAQYSTLPQNLQEALQEWERFLRWRIKPLGDIPEVYPQEIFNEFLPLAPKPMASVFKRVKDISFRPSPFFLQKIFGPPALRSTSHKDQISSVAFSKDGRFVASGSRDSTVKVWEVATGLLIADLVKDNKEPVLSIAFSLDAKFVAMQSADGAVKVWDVQTGVLVSSCVGLSGWDVNMAFSPDGRFVAAGNSSGLVKICEAQTGRLIAECIGHTANISCTVFCPNGRYMASGSCDNSVKLWEVETGRLVADCIGHKDWVNTVVFSSDNGLLASGSSDKTVKVWEVETGRLIGDCVGHNGSVFNVAFSDDGKFIVSGSKDKTVKVWEVKTGRLVANCLGHTDWVLSVDSSKKLFTSGSRDNTIKIWDIKTGRLVADCIGHKDWVFSVNFSQDGNLVASGSFDDTVKIWEVKSGKVVTEWVRQGDDNVSCVGFSRDAKLVATGDKDGMVKVEKARNRQLISNCIGHEGTVNDIVFSPDGRFIGSGGDDGKVKVWEIHTGQLILDCTGHPDWVFSVDFSPDGKYVASGSWDNTVKIWEAQTGKMVVDCMGHEGKVTSVSFSRDERFLVSGSDDRIVKIWNIVTGQLVSDLVGHKDSVNTVSFSPDGKYVASGSRDNTVKIWEVATQKVVADFLGHKDHVNTVAFSVDGSFVASGSKDRSVKIWKDVGALCINTLFFDHPLIKVGFTAIPTRSLLVADLKGQIFGYEIAM